MKHRDEKGIQYKDYGMYQKQSSDYPFFAKLACHAVNE